MLIRRLWRFVGWWGIAGIILSCVILATLVSSKTDIPGALWRQIAFGLIIIASAAAAFMKYSLPARIEGHEVVLSRLIASGERYCLVLRPFGSDGDIVVPHLGRRRSIRQPGQPIPNLTLEQVVAKAAKKSLGLNTYAMVDQDLTFAPPGPVYLRASHAQWQVPAELLIEHAFVIALILPPGQSIRQALEWEVQQITQRGHQFRVVIILPPADRDEFEHLKAFHQACILLATFEGFAGSVDDVDSLRVHRYEMIVEHGSLAVRLSRNGEVTMWGPAEERNRITAVNTYLDCLTGAFEQVKAESQS